MTKISEIYDKIFKGKSFYYVDDSVIFTDKNDFTNTLDEINKELSTFSSSSKENYSILENLSSKYSNKIIDFSRSIGSFYTIKVHEDGGKSTQSEIEFANEGTFLNNLSKESSTGAIALHKTYSDLEDISLYNKFKILTQSIEDEIERISNEEIDESTAMDKIQVEKYKHYYKKLIRYKKFFKFRTRLINNRKIQSPNINNVLNALSIDGSSEKYQLRLINLKR